MVVLARRRWRNAGITAALSLVLLAVWWLHEVALDETHFLTGWCLVVLVPVLALFTLRKKLPMLRLGDAADWLQAHIYLGWFSGMLFLLHTGFRWPTGVLDVCLWAVFVVVWISGAIGLTLSRLLPRRMIGSGERVIFERIPAERNRLAQEVRALILSSATRTRSTTIADFYHAELERFFSRPCHFLAHLTGSRRHLRRLQRHIDTLHRYADDTGRETLVVLSGLVLAKDNLDRHDTAQSTLKLWLFVHIPLTWVLLPVATVHAVLAYAFGTGRL